MSKLPETFQLPGAIDIHVHLREPGNNKAETIRSGTKAALLGGWAAVVDMPNNPGAPVWTPEAMSDKAQAIRKGARVMVGQWIGAQPESDNLTELKTMLRNAVGTKFYTAPTTNNPKDYEASEFGEIVKRLHSLDPDKPIALHAGTENLEDFIGLIAQDYDMRLHVCHVNDPEDVQMIWDFRCEGLEITCGVCPHHLLMDEDDVVRLGSYAKMQPPLAKLADAQKLMHQFNNGMIDNIETDHAPHSKEAKHEADHGGHECYGVPSLELAIPLLLHQVEEGKLELDRLREAISDIPARIAGVNLGKSHTLWRRETFEVAEEDVVSACGWTPYLGRLAVGRLEKSVVGHGEWPLVVEGKIVAEMPRVLMPGVAL